MWPIDRPPQWVDRSGELATVRAGVEALRHGGGAAVWVEGEPGIGKSSLVVEALAGASERGWNIGWGIADQLAERLPLARATLRLIDRGDLLGALDRAAAKTVTII